MQHLVINTSAPLPPQPVGVPFIDARHRAAAADVPRVTVLQPTLYLENLAGPWVAPRIIDDGVVAYPQPDDVPIPWVATDDIAVAIERVITRDIAGWFALPGIPVTGQEVAEAIGAVLGRLVRWQTITPDEYGERLRPHLGDHAADNIAAVTAIRRPRLRSRRPTPRRRVRRSAGRRVMRRRGPGRCRHSRAPWG